MKIKNFILIACISILYSCGKDNSDYQGPVAAGSEKYVFTKWGTTIADVEKFMGSSNGWSAETNPSGLQTFHYTEEFLKNKGWTGFKVVSYEFTGGILSSATALLSNDGGNVDKITSRYLSGFTYLGDKNSTRVFVDESNNSVAIVYEVTDNQANYFAIGWTSL